MAQPPTEGRNDNFSRETKDPGWHKHLLRDTMARRASEKVCTQPCVAKTSEKVKPTAESSTLRGMNPLLTR